MHMFVFERVYFYFSRQTNPEMNNNVSYAFLLSILNALNVARVFFALKTAKDKKTPKF